MTQTPIANCMEVAAGIQRALEEDIGRGDVTTQALVPAGQPGRAAIISRVACVVAGLDIARAVFSAVDARLTCELLAADGQLVAPGAILLRVHGPLGAILTAERTALNFLQRLSGIATLTRRFVDRVRPLQTRILDTRKTTPGLRRMEKYAVTCGGGTNHRMGLYDMVLIKDNHRALLRQAGIATLAAAVETARMRAAGVPVEIEVENEAELADALNGKPDWVLLDNMNTDQLRSCVALCAHRCPLEASGGVTLENVAAIAATGVDAISIGGLTHSATAVDLSLELEAME
ncbi:MAG: carboxylating nicotinate-nucleotide diphosphorylase [bacterium]